MREKRSMYSNKFTVRVFRVRRMSNAYFMRCQKKINFINTKSKKRPNTMKK